MCGIVGFVALDGARRATTAELSAAVASLGHRGPDDRGEWHTRGGDDAPAVVLGHTRLAIIDLAPTGHQPMTSASGRSTIVFNGEIYNYRELRAELEALGHRFVGGGDTEVALAAFETWGERAVDRFIGMFALALWSEPDRVLRLFRDRIGVKPLYYTWDGSVLCFASELKALRCFRHWDARVSPQAVAEYLQYGYIADPRTIYRDVHKLAPGHQLVLSKAASAPEVRPYWSVLDAVAAGQLPGSEQDLEERLEALLASAVRYRTVADVPVGLFLSGGLDSSLIASLLAAQAGPKLRTFTIGFDYAPLDESRWAANIAAHLGTDHHHRTVTGADATGVLTQWGELFDEPFGDSSGVPTYLVAKLAREDVKVAMSADGGDELFGGYANYVNMPRVLSRVESLPPAARRAGAWLGSRSSVASLIEALPGVRFGKIADRVRKGALALARPTAAHVFDLGISYWLPADAARLAGTRPEPRPGCDRFPGSFPEQMMAWDLVNYLAGDILAKVDRATMAVSLEAREPLLDHRLVEFAFRLPLSLRLGPLGAKHVIRKIVYRHLPRSLVDRPKQGFTVPMAEWLRGPLSPLVERCLEPARIARAGLLDVEAVDDALRKFRRGAPIDVNRIWLLLALELWRERWQPG